jgi:hypothetical protein
MKPPIWTTGAALVVLLCTHRFVLAESFTAPLTFSAKSGDSGEYFVADFDLHTRFSAIDSVTVNFRMPQGYEGTAMAGGSFSLTKQLWINVGEVGAAPNFGSYLGEPPGAQFLGTSIFNFPADSPQQVRLSPPALPRDPPIDLWPDFLFSAQGSVSFTDYTVSSTGFIGGNGPFTTSISWVLPGPATDATITFVGTAVPEPSTLLLTTIGSTAAAWVGRRTSRRIR